MRTHVILRVCNLLLIAVVLVGVTGCDGQLPQIQVGRIGDPKPPSPFLGLIAGDEPNAVLAGRKILAAHGNAADAAAAVGFALAVTLPSRAGIGGGGACVVHDTRSGATETLDFTPEASSSAVAPPALVRGLFALQARYGALPWAEVVEPAETMARFGTPVSRAFARDLVEGGAELFADSAALAEFLTPRRQLLAEGDIMRQGDLATFFSDVRVHGAHEFQAEISHSGTREATADEHHADLPEFTPRWRPAQRFDLKDDVVFALPSALSGGDLRAQIVAKTPTATGSGHGLPAGTGFTVADAGGNVVSCALTMGRPFGLGQVAHGLGFLLAPGDSALPLAAVIIVNRLNGEPHFAAAAAGTGAMERVAALLRIDEHDEHSAESRQATGDRDSDAGKSTVTAVNAWFCRTGLLSDGRACAVSSDPQGYGYALVVVPDTKM